MTIVYSNTPGPVDGSLITEVAALIERVFGAMDSADSVWRLQNMPDLSLFAARSENLLVGFKLGHAVTSHRYYSWLGGVSPDHRRAAKLNTEFGFAAVGIIAVEDGSKIIYRKTVDPVHARN